MSRTAEEVVKTTARPKVLSRMVTWTCHYLKFIEPAFSGIHLNLKMLRVAAESCLLDVARMKQFHGIDFADSHKRAAFTMVWVSKSHPIQLATDANVTEALLMINEYYAVHLGLSHLSVDVNKISPKYLRNLIYSLYYRDCAPITLASSMYLLDCAGYGKRCGLGQL